MLVDPCAFCRFSAFVNAVNAKHKYIYMPSSFAMHIRYLEMFPVIAALILRNKLMKRKRSSESK